MQIVQSTILFLSSPGIKGKLYSLLLNSEAWVNLTEQDIRKMEQTDEIQLSNILDCEANTNNTFQYLELGVAALCFEVMMLYKPVKSI